MKRCGMSSSTMTRSNAPAICEGIGTMKRLTTPTRIRISTIRIAATSVPSPSANGTKLRCARALTSCAPAMRFVVAHAAARFLAQVAPDLRHVAAERIARHDFGGARARQLDRHHALHLAGPVGHHQHAVGELHRLGDVVGDQQAGLLQLVLDLQHLVAEQEARLLVERAERLVHQQDLRLRGERARDRDALAHAAGELGRIAPLEAVRGRRG